MERKRKDMDMATDHGTVSPIEHDETANLRLALMERWRESCGRAAERFGRRSDIPFYSSALSALAGECADDMGKSGRVAETAVAMLADALMEKDPQGYADSAEAAARELERLVSSIAYADALGRLRAANSTFATRMHCRRCRMASSGRRIRPPARSTYSTGRRRTTARRWTPAAP